MMQTSTGASLSYKEQIFQRYQTALQTGNAQQSLELLHLIHKNNWNAEWLAFQQAQQTGRNKSWPWSR